MKRTRCFALIAFMAVVSLVGCASSGDPPGTAYVEADEKTYEAVWPLYWQYVQADPKLEQWQKDSKADTGASWKARTVEAKKALAAQKGQK